MSNDGYDIHNHMDIVDEIMRSMKEKNLYMEINPHFAEGQNNVEFTYPEATIVGKALKYGLRFSYGSDAHVSGSVGAMLNELREHAVYGKAIRSWELD